MWLDQNVQYINLLDKTKNTFDVFLVFFFFLDRIGTPCRSGGSPRRPRSEPHRSSSPRASEVNARPFKVKRKPVLASLPKNKYTRIQYHTHNRTHNEY